MEMKLRVESCVSGEREQRAESKMEMEMEMRLIKSLRVGKYAAERIKRRCQRDAKWRTRSAIKGFCCVISSSAKEGERESENVIKNLN